MTARVLVTGATGAIGRHLLPELVKSGLEVRATFRREPVEPCVDGVEWLRMDFDDNPDLATIVAGCDAVIHLAAELSDVPRMPRLNVEATEALLRVAQSLGVRYFGFASSIVVYGSPSRRHVDEASPLLDLSKPLDKQYHAEPYMLDYARSKVLAEQMLHATVKDIAADIYRPTEVIDDKRMLEAGGWSMTRKLATAYRRTQYIYVKDLVAAIVHLTKRGLSSGIRRAPVEVYNLADDTCGTYGEILRAAYEATKDPRYKLPVHLPILADVAKDVMKYKLPLRFPLGMLRFSNEKLRATGFEFPYGFHRVLEQVLAHEVVMLTEAAKSA